MFHLFFFIGTAGDSESYGQVSLSPSCSSKDEPQSGLVTIELSAGSTYHVCLNGFDRGAAAAVCHQLGFVDAKPIPIGDEQIFYGKPDQYEYVHHFTCQNVFLVVPKQYVVSHYYCTYYL